LQSTLLKLCAIYGRHCRLTIVRRKYVFKTALNQYVKTIYYDARCESVTAHDPWILPITGDGVRTSQRGRFVTVVVLKMADLRLVNQERSGKTMFQGSDMYTPAVAGYVDEKVLMPYFHLCPW
jgi:hypothetical protein